MKKEILKQPSRIALSWLALGGAVLLAACGSEAGTGKAVSDKSDVSEEVSDAIKSRETKITKALELLLPEEVYYDSSTGNAYRKTRLPFVRYSELGNGTAYIVYRCVTKDTLEFRTMTGVHSGVVASVTTANEPRICADSRVTEGELS
jgi:hypothetical protein